MGYIKHMNIGVLYREPDHVGCMCVSTSLQETLQLVVNSELFPLFEFKTIAQQEKLFEFLKESTNY